MSTTIELVAHHAQVSRQTVSNALNAPDRLKPETLRRVLAAVEELGYRPNRAAKSLRTRSTHMLGYRIEPARDAPSSPVLDRFVHALAATARAAGYHLVLFASDDDRSELATYDDLIRTNAVDGFVLSGTRFGDPRPRWLQERGAPFVTFGRQWGGDEAGPWVDVDGAAGTAAAVDHLVGLGHRRIAFVGWPMDRAVGDSRYEGWRRAMRSHRLPVRGACMRGVDRVETGIQAMETLRATVDPTAVVCGSDTLAVGCLHWADANKVRVGDDLAVVGFDDSPTAAFLRPGLTSLRQPLEQVGEEIIRMLVRTVAGEVLATPHVLLEPTLVIRESSAGTAEPGVPRPFTAPSARRR